MKKLKSIPFYATKNLRIDFLVIIILGIIGSLRARHMNPLYMRNKLTLNSGMMSCSFTLRRHRKKNFSKKHKSVVKATRHCKHVNAVTIVCVRKFFLSVDEPVPPTPQIRNLRRCGDAAMRRCGDAAMRRFYNTMPYHLLLFYLISNFGEL